MAQTNYTPISLYYSTTASAVPTAANLVPGELAINTNDGKLYYEDSNGVVQVLATKSTGSIGGSNTQVQFNNSGSLGGSSSFTWDGTTVTATKFAGALNGTVGATTPSSGAFTTLSTSSTTTFSGLTASTALALDASKNVVSVTNTGTGSNVLSTSPTLTGTVAGASLSLSSLTSGRVTYAGTAGLLQDSANLTFNAVGNLLVGTTTDLIWNTTNLTGCVIGGNASSGGYSSIQVSRSSERSLLLNRLDSDGQIQTFARQGTEVGSISVTTTLTSYNVTSDYRLKENIAPMTGALAKVAQLKPVTYKWKVNGSNGQGFIAHELQAVVPDCVTGEKDAVDKDGKPIYQGMDTSHLIATLVSAIQELKAEFDAYKATHP